MQEKIVVCRSAAAIARATLSAGEVHHPMGSIAVNCCLAGSARGQYRVALSKAKVYHPMGSIAVNCCLSSYQLSFRGERKLQRIATKGRTYGSPLDSNSLVTHAAPR